MAGKAKRGFQKLPVAVRAAIIVAGATLIAAVVGFYAQTRGREAEPKRLELYVSEKSPRAATGKLSLVAFSLDGRATGSTAKQLQTGESSFQIVGRTYPVFLAAFTNDTEKPVVFQGIDLAWDILPVADHTGAIPLEPIVAYDIEVHPGFHPFVPPLLLPARESGAVHLRLKESKQIRALPYGTFRITFRTSDQNAPRIDAPAFQWLPR
jgi:hypothetical protein